MKHILFICLGNICRSPMAEAVFRDMVQKAGLQDQILVDSAGTGGWHTGEIPHEGTRKVLDRYGIDYNGIRARKLAKQDFDAFDLLIGMDEENLRNIERIHKGSGKVMLLSFYAKGDDSFISVPDPWYTGDFDLTYRLVTKGCAGLLDDIRKML